MKNKTKTISIRLNNEEYIRLQELGIGEEAVAEEVEDLCRTLSL